MKLYAQWNDTDKVREIGTITPIGEKTDTLFIRVKVLLHPRDIDNLRRDVEEKTGRKCVVVDKTIDLDHVE